jgi:predicted short-subunit dehydrogenase-like oxidoreductase (DUF2520 family)
MYISILGRGRLGTSLAALWRDAGLQVDLLPHDAALPAAARVVLLAVPDRAIGEVALRLAPQVGDRVVLHASGSLGLEPVAHLPEHGSLHPLMTFPGLAAGLPDLRGVPAAIEGTPAAVALAEELATRLGMLPLRLPGDRRLYHAAAVIAGNFATTLLAVAGRVLAGAGVPPNEAPALLAPLALASLRNAAADPARALTGPIARGDLAILSAHRDALQAAGLVDLLPLYEALVQQTSALAEQRR